MEGLGGYLLDSNTFIAPARQYYSLVGFKSYWNWLSSQKRDNILLPKIVYDELTKDQDDALATWVKDNFEEVVYKDYENENEVWNKYREILNYVVTCGYYKDPGKSEWLKDGKADPMIIAIACVKNATIVTFEQSAGKLSEKTPVKKEPKIPDVAKKFGVKCINLFEFEKRLKINI